MFVGIRRTNVDLSEHTFQEPEYKTFKIPTGEDEDAYLERTTVLVCTISSSIDGLQCRS